MDITDKITPCTENTEVPKEFYKFNYSENELKEIMKNTLLPLCKRMTIFCTLWFALLVFSLFLDMPSALSYFYSGIFFVFLLIDIKYIVSYKKAYKSSTSRILISTYEYTVFEDKYCLNIYRDGELVRSSTNYFNEIEKVIETNNHLLVQISGQQFIFRKSELSPNSFLLSYLNNNPKKVIKSNDKYTITATVLVLTSCFSFLFAITLTQFLNSITHSYEYYWIFFLLTPISIGTVIFGFVLKKKGYKYKANIIIGILITFFLCFYGSFQYIFPQESYNYDHSVIEEYEDDFEEQDKGITSNYIKIN